MVEEKKKSVQNYVCKTTKKKTKPLANVLEKVALQRVDLAKAHVKTKKVGKGFSSECFSSSTKASVENIQLPLRFPMMMNLSYPPHLPLVADMFGSSLKQVSLIRGGSTIWCSMLQHIQTWVTIRTRILAVTRGPLKS